jgi:transglutaminase-like putative cysteine protease
MDIRIGFDMTYEVTGSVPLVVMLSLHPSRTRDLRFPEQLRTEPLVEVEPFYDGFGNRCGRLVAPEGRLRLWSDAVIRDCGEPDALPYDEVQHPVQELPPECLPYLLSSRYCEVDLLSNRAWELFGNTPEGWPRVQAVLNWVHWNVKYGYEFARATKTAAEVVSEGAGVCRDFQHLAITFCRALNIPARYASGYLGDIRVPPLPTPMDFHAWFEVFLGGRWHSVDARHNTARIGRVLMARGRDATDTALITSFGPAQLQEFKVWSEEVAEGQFEAERELAAK